MACRMRSCSGCSPFPGGGASRAARFSLVFLVVAWVSMAFTRGAGGSVHHAILLWPFPHMFIAAVFGRRSSVALAAGLVLVLFNLLVVNQYAYQFERNGAAGNFTDAINTLSDALIDSPRESSRAEHLCRGLGHAQLH